MKFRTPLRNLLVPALLALTAMSAVIAPVAHADPVSKDNTIVTDAAAAAAPMSLGSMRLMKSNGVWVTVTPEMQRNALIAINTIRSAKWSGVSGREKDRLIVIALMTMAQESTFYTHPTARKPDRNNDVGPFQQRSLVGWYANGRTQAENVVILNNIPYATRTFIEGHRVTISSPGAAGRVGYIIPGVFQKKQWRTDDLWKVAAAVQVPAAKYRYYYEYWRPVVEAMMETLEGRAPSTSSLDVYTMAGDHTVAGRKWRTTCEPFTTSIDRCRAEIWSTQVTKIDGKFVPTNKWAFNNLTYLPSAHAEWAKNPMAIHDDAGFISDGRQWKTSCNDAWTGPNACRSFIMSTMVESYLDAGGTRRYREVDKWVFNNIVKFSD